MTRSSGAGGGLPDIPEDLLLRIARHVTLNDWAEGPAQACRGLCYVHLQHVLLHIPGYWVRHLPCYGHARDHKPG